MGRSPERVAHGGRGEGPFHFPGNVATWGLLEELSRPVEAAEWRRVRPWAEEAGSAGSAWRPAACGVGVGEALRSEPGSAPACSSPRGFGAQWPGASVAPRSGKDRTPGLSAEPRRRRLPCWSSRHPTRLPPSRRDCAGRPGSTSPSARRSFLRRSPREAQGLSGKGERRSGLEGPDCRSAGTPCLGGSVVHRTQFA